MLGRYQVSTAAATKPQKTRPAARAAEAPDTGRSLPDISTAAKNGNATIAGNKKRICLLGDASITMPKPIMIKSGRKLGHDCISRLLIRRYMSAAAVSTKESTKLGASRNTIDGKFKKRSMIKIMLFVI